MKLATWNINSVRLRINLVTRFLREHQPDAIALQETKVINDLFPAKAFEKLGYVHHAIHGQKGYHGVAVLSRMPFRETFSHEFCSNSDCRHVQVTFENGIELHDFYVPAGGDIPDPAVNPKFAHKLNFLREMAEFFSKRAGPQRSRGAGRRPERGAAGERCVESQATARRRQPHAGRDRIARRREGNPSTGPT